jgi:hypothetical protein
MENSAGYGYSKERVFDVCAYRGHGAHECVGNWV